ncbi:inositol monophosphatase [Sphingosinicella sp. BN140058]|uniref:inositol monophosphatase family protein n=1 Tax=Sphingosinicella sp. BN140058 TaxID=1892855 RepID=UPI0010107138|nr:inositol monophosphatase [Sphingosinicella sp. BN140058]QAY76999.1 inositol monophosphatase [Sphingosinicella sp. BN140058]
MTLSLIDRIGDILRRAAAEAVLPRYRALASHQVEEKSPGELVTIADRDAEAAIARGLDGLVPGARFVGEEACARDPSLLERIDEGDVWIVDPLDGTANFASGDGPFAMMVALLRDGEIVAGCIYEPLTERMAAAEYGGGAFLDGHRLHVSARQGRVEDRRGIISSFMLPEDMIAPAAAVRSTVSQVAPSRRCAGHEYPRVATGEIDFALYWRTIVWDHAPGVLFLNEAGGVARRPDGSPYRPAVGGTGMLLAHNPEIADEVQTLLLGRRA